MVQGTNFPPISQEKGAENNHAFSLRFDYQLVTNCLISIAISETCMGKQIK